MKVVMIGLSYRAGDVGVCSAAAREAKPLRRTKGGRGGGFQACLTQLREGPHAMELARLT